MLTNYEEVEGGSPTDAQHREIRVRILLPVPDGHPNILPNELRILTYRAMRQCMHDAPAYYNS